MTKYCNKCNAVVEEIGNFCTQCGSNDIRDDKEEQAAPQTEEIKEAEKVEEQPSEETKEEGKVEEQPSEEVKEDTPEEKVEEQPTEETKEEETPETEEQSTEETKEGETPETTPEVTEEKKEEPVYPDSENIISDSNPISIPNAVQAFDHAAPTTPVEQNENSFANVPDFMYGQGETQEPVPEIQPVRPRPQTPPNFMQQQMQMPPKRPTSRKQKTNIPVFAAIGVAAFMLIVGIVFVLTNSNNKEETLEKVPVAPFSNSDISVSGNNEGFDTSSVFTNENSFRVGNENYGFISIPKTWTYFTDKEKPSQTLQYTDNGTWIVTLFGKPTAQENAVDWANSVYLTISQSGAQNISTSQTVIDGYTALTISAYYQSEKKYITTWFLETKNGITHYLAIEGPQINNENYNIIYSFNENK